MFWRIYGLETVALRYFNVFGPRQDPSSQYSAVIPLFMTAIIEDRPLTLHGDGTQSRDFTYVENVAAANLLACTAPEAAGAAINIACGERYSLLTLIERLAEYTGKMPRIAHTAPRPGDVPHSQADISRAKALLGYEPVTGFDEGLRRTVEWFTGRRA